MAGSRADTAKHLIDEYLGIERDQVKMNRSYAQFAQVE
jgi:hypothetical protein